jgi:hypothetical protein
MREDPASNLDRRYNLVHSSVGKESEPPQAFLKSQNMQLASS